MKVLRTYKRFLEGHFQDLRACLEREADPVTVLVIRHDSPSEQADLLNQLAEQGVVRRVDSDRVDDEPRIKDGDRVRILEVGNTYKGRTGTARVSPGFPGCFDVYFDDQPMDFVLTVLPEYLEKIG